MKQRQHRTKPTEEEITKWIDNMCESGQYAQAPYKIVRDCGKSAALIWGVIHSFEKKTNHACTLSLQMIGSLTDCSRKTVFLTVKILRKAGYIKLVKNNQAARKANWYSTNSSFRLAGKTKEKDNLVEVNRLKNLEDKDT